MSEGLAPVMTLDAVLLRDAEARLTTMRAAAHDSHDEPDADDEIAERSAVTGALYFAQAETIRQD